MSNFFSTRTDKLLSITLAILVGLFCFSLFKNIQYPLLWNDEAATVMYSKSILKYGYPRVVFDGNIMSQLSRIPSKLLEDSTSDAVKENGWLSSYIAAPFVSIANQTDNIYLKTALVRVPSAAMGIISIFLFGYITTLFLNKKVYKISAFILFILAALYNIQLTLHLREARYYSLLLFLLGIYWFILVRFLINSNLRYRTYVLSMPLVSLAILLTYPPAFIPCLVILYVASLIHKNHLRFPTIKSLFPAGLTTILSIPIFGFFDIFGFARLTSEYFHVTLFKIFSNIFQILFYLYNDELIISAIVTTIVLLILNYSRKNKIQLSGYFLFFTLVVIFCASYIAALARLPYLFTRYYIYLGVLITTVTIVGLMLSFQIFGRKLLFVFLAGIFIYNLTIHNGMEKARRFTGHIYEITHRYEGPLDVIIPYILYHTNKPEKLVIATNYEEFSYMYYLGSKVTIGYVWNNIEEDMKIVPAIIIFRPGWGSNPTPFNYFLNKYKYKKITFPIANYPLNNIPEFDFAIPHLFKTKLASSDNEKLTIFLRE